MLKLHYIMLCYIILHYVKLYCITSYYVVVILYYIILYYIIIYRIFNIFSFPCLASLAYRSGKSGGPRFACLLFTLWCSDILRYGFLAVVCCKGTVTSCLLLDR